MFLQGETLGRRIAETKPHLGRSIDPAVREITARLCPGTRGERGFEEFCRQLDDVVKRLAARIACLFFMRNLGQRHPGLRRELFDRLWEAEPFRQHHEIENAAVLAGGKVEPRHLLIIDEKRGRLLLVEWRKPLPFASRLFQPHAPADDLRYRQARAQLVEELGRKAHVVTRIRSGHDSGQIDPAPAARPTRQEYRPGGHVFRIIHRLHGHELGCSQAGIVSRPRRRSRPNDPGLDLGKSREPGRRQRRAGRACIISLRSSKRTGR